MSLLRPTYLLTNGHTRASDMCPTTATEQLKNNVKLDIYNLFICYRHRTHRLKSKNIIFRNTIKITKTPNRKQNIHKHQKLF